MATKTISVDLEAYRWLVRARRHPKETFSQVIRRAVWPGEHARRLRAAGLPIGASDSGSAPPPDATACLR